MSPDPVVSPIDEMALATLRGFLNGECFVEKRTERKFSGQKCVFVQTETGSVLGIELDRSDNATTVKKKLQLALNFPIEESSLIYGDVVLKNDLSAVRNLSPLLLTRNFMHRSSSTPCFSPTGKDVQRGDQSGPIEVLGTTNLFSRTRELVKEIAKALKIGIEPVPVPTGLGGAYLFRNCQDENCAIVKPTDEEPYAPNNPKGFVGRVLGQPGLKRSIRVGETGFREVAAYLLDYDNFANVPPTALVKLTHTVFNINDGVNGKKLQEVKEVSKIASVQQFIPHDFDASDYGTSSFPVADVHRIGILDVRILNTDRHAGNILVRKIDASGGFSQVELVPIDHGLCLPENLEDPYFEWIHWPQASIPFSEDELEYIYNLDPLRDSEMLRIELPMIWDACLRVLIICTIFLKEAAAFGFCLAEIGEMMSREFRGQEEEPSELEFICLEARKLLNERALHSDVETIDCEDFLFQFDCDGEELDVTIEAEDRLALSTYYGSEVENIQHRLFKLEENEEQSEEEGNTTSSRSDDYTVVAKGQALSVSRLSMSMKNVSIGEKSWRHEGTIHKGSYLAGISSGNRSVNEQLPGTASFVKLGDMNEEEWTLYLENFQKLLLPAFANRKPWIVGQRQRQRLGTSCQF